MKKTTVKIINRTLTILFIVSIAIIFLGYFVPQSFPINVGLIGFIMLGTMALIFIGFAIYNMIKDIKESIENEDNRDDM